MLDWQLRIVTFPGLVPVGPDTSVPVRFPFGWEAFWGVNDCPVVVGQTYMLQARRDNGGMNIYHVTQDVYPHGQYYEGTTAIPGWDLNGHVCCMNYAGLPDHDFKKDGRIINIGSVAALKGIGSSVIYSTAKAAVHQYSRCLAVQLRPYNVTVNVVAPGDIVTPRWKASREYDESRMAERGTLEPVKALKTVVLPVC